MVFSQDISTITGSTVIDNNYNQFIVNVGAGGATLTLPASTSDGQNFNFIRVDSTTGIVQIVPPDGSQFIFGNGVPISSFSLVNNTSILFVSWNGNWYMTQNSSTSGRGGLRPYYSTSFRTTGTSGFIQLRGVNPFATNSISATSFYFDGDNSASVSVVNCVIAVNALNRSYRLFLASLSGTVYATVTGTVPVANTATLVTIPITTPFPQTGTLLELRGNVDNGNTGRLNLYSLQIY